MSPVITTARPSATKAPGAVNWPLVGTKVAVVAIAVGVDRTLGLDTNATLLLITLVASLFGLHFASLVKQAAAGVDPGLVNKAGEVLVQLAARSLPPPPLVPSSTGSPASHG
jgi:hypothetical protein